jgi:hypothetical protein
VCLQLSPVSVAGGAAQEVYTDTVQNRQMILTRRPVGDIQDDDLELRTSTLRAR